MSDQPVRQTLSGAVQEVFGGEEIREILNEIKKFKKQHRFNCQHCKKINYAEIPDDVKKLEALLKVIEQTEGKPGTVDGEPGGTVIIVERNWPGVPIGNPRTGDVPAAHTADDLSQIEGEG